MAGRPKIYLSVSDLETAIKEYWESIEQSKKPPTITGLALSLGFESRQSFYDYEEKPEFTYTIKRARLQIEIAYEERLSGQNCTGAIFALKNLGWKDKSEVEQSGSLTVNWNEEKNYENK